MSVASWKKEFYVGPGRNGENWKKLSIKQALEIVIKRWEGLRKKNLERHELTLSYFKDFLHDKNNHYFLLTVETCILCRRSYTEKGGYNCSKCGNKLSYGFINY